jgi:carbon monoxide dehydrogenase subunit G
MIVEAHITINGTRTAVWSVVSDIRNAAGIISGIEKIEILNEPSTGLVGLKWRETRMYFGKPAAVDKWITEAVENEFYTTRAEMDGFVFITTMKISETGEDVKVSSSHETQAQGIAAKIKALPMILFKGMLKKAILQDLTDIKRAIEQK